VRGTGRATRIRIYHLHKIMDEKFPNISQRIEVVKK
jgi:hypothetical protein